MVPGSSNYIGNNDRENQSDKCHENFPHLTAPEESLLYF